MTRSNNSSNKRSSSKRRSTRGTRQSLLPPQDVSTNKKSFHFTITDRIKYRLHASASEHNKTTFDLETLTCMYLKIHPYQIQRYLCFICLQYLLDIPGIYTAYLLYSLWTVDV